MKLNYKFLIYLFSGLLIFFFLVFKIVDFSLKKYTLHHHIIDVPSLVGLNLSAVEDTLSKYNLNFIIIDSAAYNPDYERGSILSHSPKAGSEVKPERKIYLTINPLTVHYIPFPNLKNKSLRQGINLLENSAFRIGNIYYVDHFAKDVIRQSEVVVDSISSDQVNFNDTLPKFSVINLYLGNGYLENVIVPDLLGLELDMVKSKLNNNSLNLGNSYVENFTNDTLMIVYQQDPLANQEVEIGAFINVWAKDTLIDIK